MAKALNTKMTRILRKPGEGLLTVTTGSGAAQTILGPLVGQLSTAEWSRQAAGRMLRKGPQIVALPSDAGGGICRGAAHGPLHLRAELYAKSPLWAAHDLGDLPCVPQLLDDSMLTLAQRRSSGRALWGAKWKPTTPVAPLNLLQSLLEQGFAENPKGFRPLILGGDHSISGAVTEALFAAGLFKKIAVLHFDAHTDLLEERYGVARCFATWAAHAAKRLKPTERKNFVQVGVRTSGRTKSFWEKKFGIRQLWISELKRQDPERFAASLVDAWKKRGCERLYISFDVDALDPKFVPSTGTPEPGGLDPNWCVRVIRFCARELPLLCADVVELAPVLGSPADGRKSARAAARIASALLEGLKRGL